MIKQKRNLMKLAYEEFWVPVLGRSLSFFIRFIEGRTPKKDPTFDLRDKDDL